MFAAHNWDKHKTVYQPTSTLLHIFPSTQLGQTQNSVSAYFNLTAHIPFHTTGTNTKQCISLLQPYRTYSLPHNWDKHKTVYQPTSTLPHIFPSTQPGQTQNSVSAYFNLTAHIPFHTTGTNTKQCISLLQPYCTYSLPHNWDKHKTVYQPTSTLLHIFPSTQLGQTQNSVSAYFILTAHIPFHTTGTNTKQCISE